MQHENISHNTAISRVYILTGFISEHHNMQCRQFTDMMCSVETGICCFNFINSPTSLIQSASWTIYSSDESAEERLKCLSEGIIKDSLLKYYHK